MFVGNRLDEALTGSVQPLGAEEKAAAKMRRFMRETGRKALEIAGILMAGRGGTLARLDNGDALTSAVLR